jgi:thioredoxin reductase (NADPH)
MGSSTPRKLNVPGEDGNENIHYTVKDINEFEGKNVVVFGGGDSAVD